MTELGVDVLCCSVGPDLPYLIGYEAMPLERLTMLVVPRDGDAVLVVPRLEAPRVQRGRPTSSRSSRGTRPTTRSRASPRTSAAPRTVAIGDQTWARFVLALQDALPRRALPSANDVTGPLRVVKDGDEIERLHAPAGASTRSPSRLRDRPVRRPHRARRAPRDRRAHARRRATSG